jgi:outer membrane protein TolC
MAPSDLVQAQAQVANQKVSIQEALNGVVQAEQQLLILLGMDPNTPIDVPTDIHISSANIPDVQKSINLALQNDPTYQSQGYSLKILKRNLVVAEDQNRWTLDLVANSTAGNGSFGGTNAGVNSLVNGRNLSNNVGLNLSIPIDNVNLQQNIVNAKVAIEQAEIQYETTKKQITSNVISAIENITISIQQAQQSQEALTLNKQTLDIANAKQKYGKSSTFEVVSDARDYNNALLQETQSEISYLNAITAYDQIVGTTLDTWHISIRY